MPRSRSWPTRRSRCVEKLRVELAVVPLVRRRALERVRAAARWRCPRVALGEHAHPDLVEGGGLQRAERLLLESLPWWVQAYAVVPMEKCGVPSACSKWNVVADPHRPVVARRRGAARERAGLVPASFRGGCSASRSATRPFGPGMTRTGTRRRRRRSRQRRRAGLPSRIERSGRHR